MKAQTDVAYWDLAYARTVLPCFPSQFAAFVLGEGEAMDTIIDIGCGNGRDSIFFAQQGRKVLGLDSSMEAIGRCRARRDEERLDRLDFACLDIGSPAFVDGVEERAPRVGTAARLIYARFFLHAIDADLQLVFLKAARRLMTSGDMLAIEFRTERDTYRPKLAPPHFRSFIAPASLIERLHAVGLEVAYHVEGFGFAKRGSEDPHVARILARPAGAA